jgi:hypothetical protein
MSREATLEGLLDLKHDLGKYLVLPLSLLPKGATDMELRAALASALRATRKDRSGVHGARSLWQRFEAELPAALANARALPPLRAAVERALGWEHALDAAAPLERAAVERDLRAVQAAIAALIDEVQGG